jgi:signal peptidase II
MNEQERIDGTETAERSHVVEVQATAEEKKQHVPVSTRQRALMLLVAGTVILLDQFSKRIVETALPLYEIWAPIPALEAFFRFTHVPNTGTAFGLFPAGSLFFAAMAIVVALALIYYNYVLPAGHRVLRVALGMQLGGAIGNLLDRIRLGHVTDFFDFGPWPVFNVADTAIVAGAALLAWIMWQDLKRERAAAKPPLLYTDMADETRPLEDEWSTG